MTARAEAARASRRDGTSWIDWLLGRIDALPGPRLLAYGLLFVAILVVDVVLHGEARLDSQTVLTGLVDASFPIVLLAGLDWLNGVASRALDQLSVALRVDAGELEEVRHELLRTPPSWANAAAILALLEAGISLATSPGGYGIRPDSSPAEWAEVFVVGGSTTVLVFVLVAHGVHQLRSVMRMHRELVTIDVFRLDPLYSFATLTSWTGISLLALVTYGIVAFGLLGELQFSAVDVATTVIFGVMSVALFVIPLVGLHDRIQAEKARQRAAAGASLAAAVAELQRRTELGQYENSKEVTDVVTAATLTYSTISRIPTWPWRQETLRGFLGAVALPIVIWSVTALLGRVIG